MPKASHHTHIPKPSYEHGGGEVQASCLLAFELSLTGPGGVATPARAPASAAIAKVRKNHATRVNFPGFFSRFVYVWICVIRKRRKNRSFREAGGMRGRRPARFSFGRPRDKNNAAAGSQRDGTHRKMDRSNFSFITLF